MGRYVAAGAVCLSALLVLLVVRKKPLSQKLPSLTEPTHKQSIKKLPDEVESLRRSWRGLNESPHQTLPSLKEDRDALAEPTHEQAMKKLTDEADELEKELWDISDRYDEVIREIERLEDDIVKEG